MTRFIYANPSLCSGCDACVDACTESHKTRGLQDQARITIVRNGDASTPVVCRQCENAPCAQVCPVGAITIGKQAIELDEEKCIGCKFCVIACPFGAIVLSVSTKVVSADAAAKGDDAGAMPLNVNAGIPKPNGKIAVKCDLCGSAEKGPACVQVCPTKALFLVDDKLMRKSVNAKRAAAVNFMPFMENPGGKKG
ncbi:MAG: 4Fe-4S dicluster domain-containing protein [Oxalobacter sp.]|nr:MAG: 4Fe-4S dicluster domain-containing protein [Oxalobacter sp.]